MSIDDPIQINLFEKNIAIKKNKDDNPTTDKLTNENLKNNSFTRPRSRKKLMILLIIWEREN